MWTALPHLLLKLLLCALGSALLACSSAPKRMSGAYYETTLIKTPKTNSSEYKKLKQTVPSLYKGRSVTVVKGRSKKRYSASRLPKLSHPILRALWIASGEGYYGAEFDLKVRTPNARTPVSIYISKKGDARVMTGQFKKRAAPSVEELERRWGLRGVERSQGRGWSERARRALNLALSLLTPEELKVVQKLPIKRVKKASQANRGAVYVQASDCSASITLYDAAVTNQSDQFIGDVRSPNTIYPITTMVLLHEIGHAVHSHPARRRHCAYLRSVKERNALARKGNASSGAKRASLHKQVETLDKKIAKLERGLDSLLKRGPVLKAYQAKKRRWAGPTRYAQSSLKESFAESYALFYADPLALKRTNPTVYAWFKAGGHLKEMAR